MQKPEKKKDQKKYFWEIGFIILGLVLLNIGIDAGFNGSIRHNSKGMTGVHNGFMDALYGLLLVVGSCGSIYSKRK